MKIVMLGWELPPHNSGGLGVACYQLCKALSDRQVDIEFILPYSAQHDAPFMAVRAAHPQTASAVLTAGGAYGSYRYAKTTSSDEQIDVRGQVSRYEKAVDRLIDPQSFDVIHAHDWLTCRAALRLKEKTGKPLIVHFHSLESDRSGGGYGNPMVREIEALTMLLADRVIAVSEHTKRTIVRDYHIPAEKIEVIHNSVDPTAVQPLSGENVYRYLSLMKSQGYRVVVSITRLTMQKGLPNLLHAAQKVVQYAPKTLFLIVGSGDQEYELVTLSAELGIAQQVIFAGFQRGKNWRDAYGIGDLFVMPSISEPFGLTPLEAVGYGTPALMSKQSGVSEVLRNCLKVDYWDIDEMANQITAVVQNDALRDELQANALQEYNQLSWGKSADRLVDLYRQHMKRMAVAA